MLEKLIVYLHADQLDQPGWAVIDANGLVAQQALHDHPAGLAALAADKQVIAIIPAMEVLLTQTSLPKLNRAKLLQALPYAVEEQLVDDVADLHFAAGEQRADGQVPVAIIARAKMQSFVDLLASWQLQPEVMIPAVLTLPLKENSWQAAVSDQAMVRTDLYQGFACDNHNFIEMLNLAVGAAPQIPLSVHVNNYTDQALPDAKAASVALTETRLPMEEWMTDVANNVRHLPLLNLLQGSYATKKSKFPRMDKLWRNIVYLGVAWVALLFLYPLISYFILSHRLNHLDEQIAQVYKRQFPQSTAIIASKMRMSEKLQKLQAQVGENHLLLLLGYVGEGLHAADSVKLKRLEFQNVQLTLEVTAAQSKDFSTFTAFLSQKGLQVKQQNATLNGERINATVQVE